MTLPEAEVTDLLSSELMSRWPAPKLLRSVESWYVLAHFTIAPILT